MWERVGLFLNVINPKYKVIARQDFEITYFRPQSSTIVIKIQYFIYVFWGGYKCIINPCFCNVIERLIKNEIEKKKEINRNKKEIWKSRQSLNGQAKGLVVLKNSLRKKKNEDSKPAQVWNHLWTYIFLFSRDTTGKSEGKNLSNQCRWTLDQSFIERQAMTFK